MSLASQKRPCNAKLIRKNRKKSAGAKSGECGNAPVLLHCSWLRNPWPKPTGVLERIVKEKCTFASPFFGVFPSDRILKTSICISLFEVSGSVIYTSEFRKCFEAATYEHETFGLYVSNNRHNFYNQHIYDSHSRNIKQKAYRPLWLKT